MEVKIEKIAVLAKMSDGSVVEVALTIKEREMVLAHLKDHFHPWPVRLNNYKLDGLIID